MICNVQVSHPMVNGASEKKKKKKKSKKQVMQSLRCELCKIDCSSQEIINRHLLGKRHKKNLEKLEESKNAATAAAAAAAAAAAVKPEPVAGMDKTPLEDRAKLARGKAKGKKLTFAYKPGEDLETKKRKLLEGGTTADSVKVCTVCNVVCNSETVYSYHLAGQKHAALLKKLMQRQTTATSTLAVGPQLVNTAATATPTSTVSPLSATAALLNTNC